MKTLYDLAVIGGGSGGLAAAKEAASHDLSVVLFDYVTPTIHGTKWGLGGTCVNVGCIPKKLMHYTALLGTAQSDAKHFGWKLPEKIQFKWETMIQSVQNYLNFSYRTGLRSAGVTYINAKARIISQNQLQYTSKEESTPVTLDFKNLIIAVGGRPSLPVEIPGAADLSITSDDLFSLKSCPKKTLVIGGSYIGLECGGFLHGFGCEVTVAIRSIVLRGFDRQCAEKVRQNMEELGINLMDSTLPVSISLSNQQKLVKFSDGSSQLFDTVIYAIGRTAETKDLGLESVQILISTENKIIVNPDESTSCKNIYAIGDCAQDRPELTPVAIQSGEFLARRLANVSTELMDYSKIPTTVFTPYEYSCVGLSQEAAIAEFGESRLEIYLQEYSSLELGASHRSKDPKTRQNEYDVDASPQCLSKLICDKEDDYRVVGFHYVGPNAGEICQGFALALRLGAKKRDFDRLVGIHPTDAESFCNLGTTLSSGKSFRATGGCGGGKCG